MNEKGHHLIGCSCLPPLSALTSRRLEFGKTIFCGQCLAAVSSGPLTSSAVPGPPLLVSPTPRLAVLKLATPSHRLLRASGSVPKDRSSVKNSLWGARVGRDWVGGGLGGAPSTSQEPALPPRVGRLRTCPPPQGWGHASLSVAQDSPLLSRPLPPEDQKPPRDDLFLTTASLPPADTCSRHQPITSCGSGSAAGPVQADSAAWICICKTKQRHPCLNTNIRKESFEIARECGSC